MTLPTRNDSGAIKYTLKQAAKALGTKGGKATSPDKARTARENGKEGGRK